MPEAMMMMLLRHLHANLTESSRCTTSCAPAASSQAGSLVGSCDDDDDDDDDDANCRTCRASSTHHEVLGDRLDCQWAVVVLAELAIAAAQSV